MDMNNLEHLTGEDILYDPRSDTYKVIVGDRMVEVPDYPLRSERLNMLKDALKDPLHYTDDAFRRDYLGDWAEVARARTATEVEEAARVGSTLTTNDGGVMTYQHDRFPSIPFRSVIEDAIELLRKNKKLRLSKISLNRFESRYVLAISSRSFGDPEPPLIRIRTLEISISYAAFDRALETELDREAGLKASLDTDTYIKLRIAFLLYKALSMNDEEAKKFWMVGIFSVLGSSTRHDFSF